MADKHCTVDGCWSKVIARGYCWKHYRRVLRTGNTTKFVVVYKEKFCIHCGSSLNPSGKYINKKRKFCNRACFVEYKKDHIMDKDKKKKCVICGNPIVRYRYPNGQIQKYCFFLKKKTCTYTCAALLRARNRKKRTPRHVKCEVSHR